MKNKNLDIKSLKVGVGKFATKLKPYTGVFFFLLIALAYGFIVLRINSLSAAQVDPMAVDAQIKATPTPHIDANTIEQLQTLKDNSVNVQTLFEDDRINPFQE